jgi:hypothetical protein
MNPLSGMLVLAGLFVLYGLVERRFGRAHRSCGSCTLDARDNACSTCPLYEVEHD